MIKEPIIFLEHIVESIEQIEKYAGSLTKEQFESSLEIQDAVLRRLEIIGEAVKNLPADFKEEHPGIPWKKIAGTRDFLTHEYFDVDTELVWEILQRDLAELKDKIAKILSGLAGQ